MRSICSRFAGFIDKELDELPAMQNTMFTVNEVTLGYSYANGHDALIKQQSARCNSGMRIVHTQPTCDCERRLVRVSIICGIHHGK